MILGLELNFCYITVLVLLDNVYKLFWFCLVLLHNTCLRMLQSLLVQNWRKHNFVPKVNEHGTVARKKIRTTHWYMNTPGSD